MNLLVNCKCRYILELCILIKFVLGQWGDGKYNKPQWESSSYSSSLYAVGHDEIICKPGITLSCFQPPFHPFDPIHIAIDVGTIVGRSMVYTQFRYVNWFLGIPYARPPIDQLRFKNPVDPEMNWGQGIRYWDASYYRHACPQEVWKISDKYYEPRNISEDCLHLNIFAPNLTDRPALRNRNYAVMVFVHGEDYKFGDAMLYPGHIIGQKEILVVTFNYRLGALGFMSTLDNISPGNYGLYDVLKVLEWIQKFISKFGGNPNQVTLVGSDSGSSLISLLLLSPKRNMNGKPLFHRVILTSGTDYCEWSFIGETYGATAYNYARELGRQVGCDPGYWVTTEQLVQCLRRKHFDEIVNASANVYKMHGSLAGPFGPVVDGAAGILPKTPAELRANKEFMEVKIIAGLNRDEGAFYAGNISKVYNISLKDGIDPATFRDIVYRMVHARTSVKNVDEVAGAIEYQYTFWTKPDNKTAVRQNLIDMWSDMRYGWCADALLKSHVSRYPNTPVYMYIFGHRSLYEVLPLWMGTPHGRDIAYLFGHPFFNETLGNITGVMPLQEEWTYADKNISNFVQDMWVNFTKYGIPTTEWTRNVTWYPFVLSNMSYLYISEWSSMEINYRQDYYAFWREYFPVVASRRPITTTPQPTPLPLIQYKVATGVLIFVSIIGLAIAGLLAFIFWKNIRSSKQLERISEKQKSQFKSNVNYANVPTQYLDSQYNKSSLHHGSASLATL